MRNTFLSGGGEMGERLRSLEGAAGLLGAPTQWPLALKTLVGVMLSANQPMFVAWGPERALFYNDAYAVLLGRKHPEALGRPFFSVWSEIEAELTPLVEEVFAGRSVQMKDIELQIQRGNGLQEAHFAFCYTPVRGDDGAVAGLFCCCTETTEAVAASRGRAFGMALAEQLQGLDDPRAIMASAVRRLGEHLRASRVGYGHIQADEATVVFDAAFTEGVEPLTGSLPLASLSADTLDRNRRGLTVVHNDVALSPVLNPALATRLQTGALVSAPLIREGRFKAFLYVTARTRRAWSSDEVALIEEVAARTWDAVQRAQAQAAQRESEAYVRLLLESTAEGLYAVDPTGTTLFCNRAFVRMLGFASETEVLGRRLHDVVHHSHPDGSPYPAEDCPIYLCARDGMPAHIEGEVFFRIDGSRLPVEYWAIPIVQDGVHRGAICTFLDVTERRRAEQALREMNDDLELQVAHRTTERDRVWRISQDLIFIIDTAGVIQSVNPAATSVLGWTREEMVGRDAFDFIHPDDHPASNGALEQAAREQLPTYVNRYRHKDGGWRWLSWVASPEAGRIYATARHITAEREQAEALAQAQEALRQSQKMEALGQLTGGIAHDFNNLLTGIIGSMDIVRRRLASGRGGDVDRFIDAATTAAQRAAALTHRLLAFARRQSLDAKPADVNALVAGMEDLLHRTLGEDVELATVLHAGLWSALADANQLESALLNLAINARDAMPSGGRLTIETADARLDEAYARAQDDVAAGEYVAISVSDTGTGMAPEVVDKAFDPFFTTKPIGQGTGLGLSMIYGFAKQSNGHVRIYSEVGQGTTVKLYLPRAPVAAAQEGEQAAAEAPRGRGETVLVVEDEPGVRLLVTEVLDELGYDCIEAADARAAIPILQSERRIDLLVTDVGLPNMNGRQLADIARQARPDLRVLFITGYAQNAAVRGGFLGPGMEMLTKPFALDTLAAKIREMIER